MRNIVLVGLAISVANICHGAGGLEGLKSGAFGAWPADGVAFGRKAPARPAAGFAAGLDVLEQTDFAILKGKRVGVITNQTGVDRSGRGIVDVLFEQKSFKLGAIFSPEHGFRGTQDEHVGDSVDPVTGLPIYSLYGKNLRPTEAMLRDLDVLVFDIQDVGARFYTYLTTMGLCMEEAAKLGKEFVVLDRPNPLGGEIMEGPVFDVNSGPFNLAGYYPVPVRHGMTPGEMARLEIALRGLSGLKFDVIPVSGWTRGTLYDQTGYNWINPSPNLRGLDAAFLYPGLGLMEDDVSVGRGTKSPFSWFGAPWMDARAVIKALRAAGVAGAEFSYEERTPQASVYKGRLCRGVHIKVTDRGRLRPVELFVHAVCAMRGQRPVRAEAQKKPPTIDSYDLFNYVMDSKDSPAKILADFEASKSRFASERASYLIYR